MKMYILAIETSCDDTSASILFRNNVLSNIVASQEVHKLYGGVVPEVASRAHQANIVPVVEAAMQKAGIKKEQLNAIAFTRGPGLLGSLLVGVSFAKALALSLGIPMIEVNHMQAHILAHFIGDRNPQFPFLCLTVSGGHTQIVRVDSPLEMTVLGNTVDEAAGEAFDKTGKMLGLDYPAGPIIDRLARQGTPKFSFPEPKMPEYDFSFSGLKTSILQFLQKNTKQNENFVAENLNDICASVQYTIVQTLLKKLHKAAKELKINQLAIAGGVSANSELRTRLQELGDTNGYEVFIPAFQYCTDNAAMIGITAYFKYQEGLFCGQEVAPYTRGIR